MPKESTLTEVSALIVNLVEVHAPPWHHDAPSCTMMHPHGTMMHPHGTMMHPHGTMMYPHGTMMHPYGTMMQPCNTIDHTLMYFHVRCMEILLKPSLGTLKTLLQHTPFSEARVSVMMTILQSRPLGS